MIKHIVMWTLKDHAEGADKAANIQTFAAKLESCRGIVPGMHAFEVVTAAAAGAEFTADIALYSEFEDMAALQAYQTHPGHKAIGPFVAAVRLTRNCLDFEA
jgi:ABC-type transporter Mla maintaining outer membrane lipid asymmetry permease subunit MlaE